MSLFKIQGHQTYNKNVYPEQGYTHAKFEKSCINSVQEKSSVTFFSNNEIFLDICKNQK